MMEVVEAAEMLNFVDTPKRQVVLDATGQCFLKADPERRQAIWREQLLKLRLYKLVDEALERAPRHTIDEDFVLETLVLHLPHENYQRVFRTFIGWGRFGDLFTYDESTRTLARPSS